MFAVGEGKGWGGRCIPACVTGGWFRGGEGREESCKNKEVPLADVGGQVSGGAGQGERIWKKEGKRNLSVVSEFIRRLGQRQPLASPLCPQPCEGEMTCWRLHHLSCIVAAVAIGLHSFA